MKRITGIFAALAVLLALPANAAASVTNTDSWIVQDEYTYHHFVRVCDVGYPSNGEWEDRIVDALNEWNEIGGELSFAWQDITNSACDNYMATDPRPWIKITPVALGGNTVGQTDNNWVNGSGQIYNCLIKIDMGFTNFVADYTKTTLDYGTFYWNTGSDNPTSSEVDFESVLVHEIGHCLAVDGHLDSPNYAVMYDCMNPTCGQANGIEKDELTSTYDRPLYTNMYGTTH